MFKAVLTVLIISFAVRTGAQSYVPEQDDKRMKVKPRYALQAWPFDLADVKITGGPFAHALSMDSAYLLSLSPDRLLYRFNQHAGLPVKDSIYEGWESEGLSGHTLGHYLSACAMMYVSTGDPVFKERVDYICAELRKGQKARKTGYVGAIPGEDTLFARVAEGKIKSSGFDLNGGWSPWYTVHKVMAGLVDAYLYCGSKQALTVVTGMADWTYNTVYHLPDSLRLKMLNCEYGGMNEVLANIYAITGKKKYLDLSYTFRDEFVMGKLARRIDPMPGKHSNTNVPKAIGSARQYELTGDTSAGIIARFFWETMVNHHSYVIGGNSNYEYCGRPDSLNDRLSDATCETCNTYNMLKLTRHLFALNPGGNYMDYYERALYNHILASQNPENGMMTYFVPLRMGAKKEFSTPFTTFTCCVGSGMENHSKYAEQIYSHTDHALFINLFIPSVLNWKKEGVVIRQETDFPASASTTLVYEGDISRTMYLYIRKPAWQRGPLRFFVNGVENRNITDYTGKEGDNYPGYIPIRVAWRKNDRLEIRFNMDLYTESMPDNKRRIALKYGPLVLAGELGTGRPDPVYGTPVLITGNRPLQSWVEPVKDQPLTFKMINAGRPHDVTLVPFYRLYHQFYSVYWDYFTEEGWAERKSAYEAGKKRQQDIENRTIDVFRVGEMQPERDHKLEASERSYVSEAMGRSGREARSGHYFSFDMKTDPDAGNALLLTYIGDDKGREFDILVDGVKLAKVEWAGGETGRFYDVVYPLPENMVNGKNKVTIRIDAAYRSTAGRIFAARIIHNNK